MSPLPDTATYCLCLLIPFLSTISGAIGIVIRTHDGPNNSYIPLFFHTILDSDYYK